MRRNSRDTHDDPPKRRAREPAPPVPTLAERRSSLAMVLGLLQAERLQTLRADGFCAVDDPMGSERNERPAASGALHPLRW